MSSSVLDRLFRKRASRLATDTATYSELVARVARGDDIDTDKLDTALIRLNKTPAEFDADVHRLEDRIRLAAKVAESEDVQTELNTIQEKVLAANNDYATNVARAERERDCIIDPLVPRERELIRKLTEADDAKLKLINGCLDPVRLATAKAAETKYRLARENVERLLKSKEDLPTAIPVLESELLIATKRIYSIKGHPQQAWIDSQMPGLEADKQRLEEQLATAKADLETAPSRIAAARAEADQAHAEVEAARAALATA